MDIFDLTKEQQKSFNALKRAYASCKKNNVNLVNQYGTLYAYNGLLIQDFGDDEILPRGHAISYREAIDKFIGSTNNINNVDSGRADDENQWMLGLTDKGLEVYENQEEY